MKLNFLQADEPIRKSYKLGTRGELIKTPYPFVYEVSSYEHEIESIEDFYAAVTAHADMGHTLLKGKLGRRLIQESRAGATDPDQPSEWICLDLDGVEGFQSTDTFLASLGISNVSYIRQWSSSQGVEGTTGFRCHLFILLDRPIHPTILKQWLQHHNLNNSILANQLELTKTGNSLRWPLDVSTCQNDKLLYVAAPKFELPLTDPFALGNRIELIKLGTDRFVFPANVPTPDSLRQSIHQRVNKLRESAGLEKRRKTAFKFEGTVEYMPNPDRATITDMKEERGFVYFNLNNGDSWAYYHPSDNPKFIFNFKGEPTYRTEDLLPDYYAKLKPRAIAFTPTAAGLVYLAFRDFRSSNYYNGIYDQATGKLTFAQAKTESQLKGFMKQHGLPIGDFIPDWDIVFEPTANYVVDTNSKKVNIFEPSDIMKNTVGNAPATVPPTIEKVIKHVLGGDQATYDHFINWLAVAVQTLGMTGTAWVLHGTQGTGKGVLFHHILTPLFGEQNVVSKRMEELESEFTGFMENKFIAFIDEVEAGKSMYKDKITAKLKNLITEPRISIRKMYHPAFEARNFCNMIFSSNKDEVVEVAPDDRRFNVGFYQPAKIQLSATEIFDRIPAELPGFYAFLMSFNASPATARQPLQSAARAQMVNLSTPAVDQVAQALNRGDLEFFWDQLKDKKQPLTHLTNLSPESKAYNEYRELLIEIVKNPTASTALSREDLRKIFEWTVGNMPDRPNKFTSYLKHHRINLESVWCSGRSVRGIKTSWVTPANHAAMIADINNDKV